MSFLKPGSYDGGAVVVDPHPAGNMVTIDGKRKYLVSGHGEFFPFDEEDEKKRAEQAKRDREGKKPERRIEDVEGQAKVPKPPKL